MLCARDAKFAVECDTCRMPYCLVCLASGTKDPCVRCGHRPSKRMEQLVHLRLKSIYKAFKQSGASGPGSRSGVSGGPGPSGGACRIADGGGRDGSTVGGKYSSALRSLTDGGSEPPSSKDNFASFDQSMASEVAAVLQTASSSMPSAEADDARRARGKRLPSRDHSPVPGGTRHARASSRASNAVAERYFRKTQAEMEAAAAAAEAEAEAAAEALLAELDEEKATSGAASSKKSKKKKKKKDRKKEAAAEAEAARVDPAPPVDKYEPKSSTSQKDSHKDSQKNAPKKKGAKKDHSRRSKGPSPVVPIEDDSSEEEMNFEQLVGRAKTGTRPSKKEKKDDSETEKKTIAARPKPKEEPPPPAEAAVTAPATTVDYDAELAVLLSNDDEEGLMTLLANLKGVPGLGAARKTAKKAIKRIREARQPPVLPVEPEKPSQALSNSVANSSASNSAESSSSYERLTAKPNHDKSAPTKTAHQKQSARAASVAPTAGTAVQNPLPPSFNQYEPLLKVVSRTQSNTGTISSRCGTSNSTSVPVSARAECVMHMSPTVVGWVIGKGGSRIRDMMEESGAKIWIDQESMGMNEVRVVYVSGKRSSVDAATRMVKDLVSKAPVAASAGVVPASAQASSTTEAAKEPTSFAAAIGSGASTPAAVTPPCPYPTSSPTKQASSTQSWAMPASGGNTAFVPLPTASRAAPQSVKQVPPLETANTFEAGMPKLFPEMLCAELVCDPRFVALLIGRRGWTMKNIQTESGADLQIDQSMDPPKIIISGKADDVKQAERMVRDVLKYPQAQLNQQSSQLSNDFGAMNDAMNIANGVIDHSTSRIQNVTSDKQINSSPLPLPTCLQREVSSSTSTPQLLEELNFQQDSSHQSTSLHAEGAMVRFYFHVLLCGCSFRNLLILLQFFRIYQQAIPNTSRSNIKTLQAWVWIHLM